MRLILFYCLLLLALSGCVQNVREPSHAGTFYPADTYELAETVSRMLAEAGPVREEGMPVALIAPHAGYRYSGQTAAKAIKHITGREIHTVIILGASHYQTYNGAALYTQGGMKTPLGTLRVNEPLAQAILAPKSGIIARPEFFDKEHAIEVLLPLIQGVNKNMMIVPVLTGTLSTDAFDHMVKMLSGIMRNDDRVMLLVSTDLSHYHDYDTAAKMDAKMLDAIKRMSVADAEQYFATGESGACGRAPLLLAMTIAGRLGAGMGQVYEYSNTGDVTGERKSVVGYAAAGLYRKSLNSEEKSLLLSLAKKTVEEYITLGSAMEPEISAPWLNTHGTTFVSITRNGVLRGCIGNVRNPMPLYKSVMMNAVAASSKDPRFEPVKKEELGDLRIEVSVLSLFEPVRDLDEIKIGRHGLYLVKGTHSALLLPQVADEGGWDLDTFLEKISVKAGLRPDGWTDAQLFRFTVEVIR
ncbi:MAG: hypothetical protein C0402_16010 [Thermodesulfovibrio sp.]|nr:hypothetical protein [Thermodesulfovibrio sp.]